MGQPMAGASQSVCDGDSPTRSVVLGRTTHRSLLPAPEAYRHGNISRQKNLINKSLASIAEVLWLILPRHFQPFLFFYLVMSFSGPASALQCMCLAPSCGSFPLLELLWVSA